jgi:hypothetical protein
MLKRILEESKKPEEMSCPHCGEEFLHDEIDIAHAKSEIEKLIEGIVPKEKPEPIREGSWSVTDEDIYNAGFNACIAEIKRRTNG